MRAAGLVIVYFKLVLGFKLALGFKRLIGLAADRIYQWPKILPMNNYYRK